MTAPRSERRADPAVSEDATATAARADGTKEQEIRVLLARLGRPDRSGGTVIERAALLAEGADFDATIAWILAHGGQPEARAIAAPQGGMYGRKADGSGAGSQTPRRFVLPPGALKA
jgi:hypothetical protein